MAGLAPNPKRANQRANCPSTSSFGAKAKRLFDMPPARRGKLETARVLASPYACRNGITFLFRPSTIAIKCSAHMSSARRFSRS